MGIDWLSNLDEWQSSDNAPRDGTPIYVSVKDGPVGVFYWEEREEFLGTTLRGDRMPPAWVGVFITTELDPAMYKNEPLGDRLMGSHGLDEGFMWRPLPARPPSHGPMNEHSN